MTSGTRRWGTPIVLVIAVASLIPTAAASQEVTFTAGITPGSGPTWIVEGPDGNLWFTETTGGRIGRITPDGVVTEFPAGTGTGIKPAIIAAGPDGALWFTEFDGSTIRRITTSGAVTEFSTGTTSFDRPLYITAGPDGNIWYTDWGSRSIGRLTPTGELTEFSVAPEAAGAIVAAPDGNLWFMTVPGRNDAGGFGRITTSGVVTLFAPDLVCCAGQRAITVGPDGNIWFTGNHLGRITMDGEVTEFPVGAPGRAASAITAGSDGNLWFTERPNVVARATTNGVVTVCHDLGPNSDALSIASGPDGNLWIAEPAADRISRVTTACAPSPVTVQPTLTG